MGVLGFLGRGLRGGRGLLLLLVPLAAFLAVAGFTLAIQDGDAPDDETAVIEPTLAIEVEATQPLSSPVPSPTAAPTPEPTPTPVPDREDCDEVQGTPYRSPSERTWYLANCVAEVPVVSAAVFSGPLVPATRAPAPASGDRLIIQRLSINAPVGVRKVEADGAMANPNGAWDVVWYDFSLYRGLGGYPGLGGNAVFAGHVDYYSVGAAVFYNLRYVVAGDVIEYYTSSGEYYRYVVDWASDLAPTDNWTSVVASGSDEVMTLVTCNGSFDYNLREYSHRRVVRAHREL